MDIAKNNSVSSYPMTPMSFIIDPATQFVSLYHFLSKFPGKDPQLVQLCQVTSPGLINVVWEARSCSRAWTLGAHPVNGEETTFNGMGESWGDVQKRRYWKTSSIERSLLTQYKSLLQERELALQLFQSEIHDKFAPGLKTNLHLNPVGCCTCGTQPTCNCASV